MLNKQALNQRNYLTEDEIEWLWNEECERSEAEQEEEAVDFEEFGKEFFGDE